MNVQIQGVNVYGGGPQRHNVFTGQQQRQRRQFLLRLLTTMVLAVVLAWCMRSALIAIAEPPQATANPAQAVQVHVAETTQQPDRA